LHLEKDEYLNEVEIQNSALYELVIRLFCFINREFVDHRNLKRCRWTRTFRWQPNQCIIWKYLHG